MEEKIRHLLASLVHPETGQDIVSSGFIEHIASAAGKITVVLRFAKARDPFAVKIKNQAEELLKREFPDQTVLVVIKEGGAAPRPEPKLKTTTGGIAKDDQPKFAKVTYSLKTYGLIVPVSNELANDEVANLFG